MPSTRKLDDWIASFEEYTSTKSSPALHRRWAAITTVACALERKVWVFTMGENFYPNLYVILCAPPGVGKTIMTGQAYDLMSKLGSHKLGSHDLSKASLLDELVESERHIIKPGKPVLTFNSLAIISNELHVLIPDYDSGFMAAMTDLYDCRPFAERKRGKELYYKLQAPQVNLLAATTPGYLRDKIPASAWDHGFLSRCIICYSGDKQEYDIFKIPEKNEQLYKDLQHDLKLIGSAFGELKWTPDAMEFMSWWHKSGGEPIPDHPKLKHYNTRRTGHALKLCQVACLSDASNEMAITKDHVDRAISWLIQAEEAMPEIFKAMAFGGDAQIISDTFHHFYKVYLKSKQPIAEARLTRFVQQRTPAHNVGKVIDQLVKGGWMKVTALTKGGKAVIPVKPKIEE